jgi:hypothetical protein
VGLSGQRLRTLVTSISVDADESRARPWRPQPKERVEVRDEVPRWGGTIGTVRHIGPATTDRPVKVRFPDGDERDFDFGELAPAGDTDAG